MKRLGQAVGAGLDLVLQMQAVLAAVTQQRLKARGVGRGGDDQNVLNARQHQGRQRIVDHRLVIDGQQLFGCDHRQRVSRVPAPPARIIPFIVYNSFLFSVPCAPPIPLGHNLTQYD